MIKSKKNKLFIKINFKKDMKMKSFST